jgi:hypothetical protein
VGVGAPSYCTRRGARCTVRSSRSVSRECGVVIGEAATCEARGESFALPCEVWADAAERQEAARSESDPEIMLGEWFGHVPHGSRWSVIRAADLVHLALLAVFRSSRTAILRKLGFRRERINLHGKRSQVWVRGPQSMPCHIERGGIRYIPGVTSDGRARVEIRMGDALQAIR